jgi:hypothetical protein
MNKTQILLSIGNQSEKNALLPFIEVASENKNIFFYTTEHTHQFLKQHNVKSTLVYKISDVGKRPNISELLSKRVFDYIINIPSRNITEVRSDYTDGEIIRKIAAEYGIISITDLDVAEIILGNLGSK